MDFMKWINSLDELLYEVTSWLLFFPLTLWRAIVRPLAMMDYAERQLALPQDEQYGGALSPPLFLALALLLAHGLTIALGQSDDIVANHHGLANAIDDDASALVLRLIIFGAFPILAAARLVRRQHLPLDRAHLRFPFYAQCYPATILALSLGAGTDLALMASFSAKMSGGFLILAGLLHYVVVQTRWFAGKLGTGHVRGLGAVILVLLEGLCLLRAVGYLLKG
jgi:hypothetical protein